MTQTAAAPITDIPAYCRQLADAAIEASRQLAVTPGRVRADALRFAADALVQATDTIIAANQKDLDTAREMGLSDAMIDRLTLDAARVEKMANSVRQIADQPDPVGEIVEGRVLPNGIKLRKVRVPIGVVLIIFESRPNVTSDAAALCLKSGNAVVLRGGKEAAHSNAAIASAVAEGLKSVGLHEAAVQLVGTTDRAAVGELLRMDDRLDLCIPRGGESLIRAVVEQARIPVIKHYTGNCHVYLDSAADHDMAEAITLNAKTQRTGVCNAAETLLVHRDHVASGLLERVCAKLADAGVELRGDESVQSVCDRAKAAEEADWGTEYLDMVLAVRVVDSLDEAVAHINRHGSRHTDAIVTSDIDAADRFVEATDTANAFVNCSTRFSDGGEYGLGAEIGISTDKLHSRGPMGAVDLTTYKWVAQGSGHVRE